MRSPSGSCCWCSRCVHSFCLQCAVYAVDRDSVYVTSRDLGSVTERVILSPGILPTPPAVLIRSVRLGWKRRFAKYAVCPWLSRRDVVERAGHPLEGHSTEHAAFCLAAWAACTHFEAVGAQCHDQTPSLGALSLPTVANPRLKTSTIDRLRCPAACACPHCSYFSHRCFWFADWTTTSATRGRRYCRR